MPPRGINTAGDIITETLDGRTIAVMWNELQAATNLRNSRRTAIEALLSVPVTVAAEAVPQAIAGDTMELASEVGLPVSLRTQPDVVTLGYRFDWYDSREEYTFQFLVDATAEQIRSVHAAMLEGDTRLTSSLIMRPLFNNARRVNKEGNVIFPLWAGQPGDAPPAYLNNSFADAHQHYLTTSGPFEAVDLEAAIRHVTHHGYGVQLGSRLLVLANETEADLIRSFRAGVLAADGTTSRFDFIPSSAAPPYLTAETIVGNLAPESYENLPLIGSFGPAWVAEESNIPPGYVLVTSTGGRNSGLNPVAFREHPRTDMRGLKLVGGSAVTYPLSGSVYARGAGTGTRHRGAAAVLQVTNSPTYTPPARFI